MTKAELIEEVSRTADLPKRQCEIVIDTFISSIIRALSRGEKIELRGFGSFRVRERPARTGRNPKTGAHVTVPEKRIPYFKAGKELKQTINP